MEKDIFPGFVLGDSLVEGCSALDGDDEIVVLGELIGDVFIAGGGGKDTVLVNGTVPSGTLILARTGVLTAFT